MSASALDDDRRPRWIGTRRAVATARSTPPCIPCAAGCTLPAVAEFVAPSRHVARAYGLSAEVIPPFGPARAGGRARLRKARRGVAFAGRLARREGDRARCSRSGAGLEVAVAGAGPLEDAVRAGPRPLRRPALARGRRARAVRSPRVAVVPSRWAEPAALVALEAMAVGTPVVAYRVGGLAELVEAGGACSPIAPASPRRACAPGRGSRGVGAPLALGPGGRGRHVLARTVTSTGSSGSTSA